MPNGKDKQEDQLYIPGLEPVEDEVEEFHLGKPSLTKVYFDTNDLPDVPQYQRSASHSQTYILHVVLPSWDDLKESIEILTGGDRKGLAKSAALATINGTAKKKGTEVTLIEWWKESLDWKK